MFYTVYKITNGVNGKTYIGKHQTKNLNDGYMGSGRALLAAMHEYGKDSFTKEILFVFATEAEMNAKEKELVVVSEDTYNLCPGGHGGFGYINDNRLGGFSGKTHTPEAKAKMSRLGWKHSPETIASISKNHMSKTDPEKFRRIASSAAKAKHAANLLG